MSDTVDTDATTDSTTDTTDTSDSSSTEDEIVIDIVVEDGTCVSGANSYITYDDTVSYMKSRNRTDWLALTEAEQKSSILKAVQYIDATFRWKGRRKYSTQRLAFPRVELFDYDRFPVTGIPQHLKDAVCEAAYYGYKSELFATYDSNGAIKRQRVEGAVEVEYFSEDETETDYVSKYASLNNILKGLYFPKKWRGFISTPARWCD